MPYEIKTDENNKIVITRVSGKVKIEEHNAACEETARTCVEKGFKLLLVDLRELTTVGVISTTEIYRFGENLANDEHLKGVRITQVLPEQADSRADVGFVSTVATNRGRIIGEFNTIEEAKKWLLSS